MATKSDTNAAVAQFLGRVKSGATIYPEDADRVAATLGIEDEVADAAASPDKVFEWVDASTRQDRVRLEVPEHLTIGESEARKVLDNDVTVAKVAPPQGTGSNDPAVNAAATGQEPFENDQGIGYSGQVIDAGEYREDAKSSKSK